MSAWIETNLQNPRVAAEGFEVILKSFCVLASAGVFCLFYRRAAASLYHLIWFFALTGLLLLPLFALLPAAHRSVWGVSAAPFSGNEISLSLQLTPNPQAFATDNQLALVLNQHSSTEPVGKNRRILLVTRGNHNWMAICLGIWAAGVILALLHAGVGRFQLRKISRDARRLETPSWTSLLNETSATLGLRRRVWLLQANGSVMPLTWGWLRPKVLLPAEAEQWSVERQRIVLLHELAHVKRWDCLTQNIARVTCALYWFNPLAWLAAQRMRAHRERACDDLVLNGGCRASEYANHLVEIAKSFRPVPQTAAIAMARPSGLETRIRAVVDASRARRFRPMTAASILILLGGGFYLVGASSAQIVKNTTDSAVSQQTLAQIEKFSAEKEAQSKMLAAASGETISPQFQKYFDAAKKGDFQTVTNMYADFKKYHPQYAKNPRLGYRTAYWQPMLEIALVYDQFAMCDSKFTRQAVDDIINSIPAGSIYFGGTDPGRGLPTAFSKSHVDGDPFYTISQNPLADTSYEAYLQNMYGEKRRTLAQLAAARQADPGLSKLDRQFQAAEQKALTLEMSKPDDDPARLAADKAVEDLSSNIDQALTRVEKSISADQKSAAANTWNQDKVIYIPTRDDVDKCFQDYMADAKKRKEENKLMPGEDVKVDANGHVQVSGQVAVMNVNARIAKLIFDKNPSHDFYVEESFPLDWMYPHLEPNGLILKINREALAELPEDIVQKDQDYWQTRVNEWLGNWLTPETSVKTVADFAEKVYGRKDLSGFTGDAGFVRDNYAPKMYSKWRSAIAGVYSWRLGASPNGQPTPSAYLPKDDPQRQRMINEADFAFKQAFAICPYSPEAVYRYINFLMQQGRKSDALLIAQAAARIDPEKGRYEGLLKNLSAAIDSQVNQMARVH